MSQEQLIIFNRKRDQWMKEPKAFAQDEPLLALAFKGSAESLKSKQDLQTLQHELSQERERTRTLIAQVRNLEEKLGNAISECFQLQGRLEEAYLTREDLAQLRHLIEYQPTKAKPRKQFQAGEQKALAGLGWKKNARA